MKYIYFLVIPILIAVGCSSSKSEQYDKDLKQTRKTLDSLKVLNSAYNKTLDSLKGNTKTKDDDLRFMQQQLDSLQKNMKEVE